MKNLKNANKEVYYLFDNNYYYTIIEIYNNTMAIEKHFRFCDDAKIYDELLTEFHSVAEVRKAIDRLGMTEENLKKIYERILKHENN